MKKFFNKFKFFIFGVLAAFALFSVAVNADWRDDVTPMDVLTSDSWNGLKNRVLSLEGTVDNINTDVINIDTSLNNLNLIIEEDSCFGGACNSASGRNIIEASCPSSNPILIGGDCIYYDHDHTNWYPRLDRSSAGGMLNDTTYRCYCHPDGNGDCIIKIYCLGY